MSNILANNINPRSGNKITIGGINDAVSIAGTVSYEDVTNVDSVGIITARIGVSYGVPGAATVIDGNATGIGIGTDGPGSLVDIASGDLEFSNKANSSAIQTINFSDGTQGRGKIQYKHDGDSMAFHTLSAERLRITSAGNIGIGTDDPEHNLVVGGSGVLARLRIRNYDDSSGRYASLNFKTENGGENGDWSIYNERSADAASSYLKIFKANGTGTHMYFKDPNEVGIRSSFYHVDSNGADQGDSCFGFVANTADPGFKVKSGGTERLRITNAGITSITGSLSVNGDYYPTTGPLSNRNLVINGAMQVAQRGTTSTDNGYKTVDRWNPVISTGTFTQTQSAITSGAPYDEGFRYSHRLTITGTSTNTSAYCQIQTKLEAQDIAGSGWKYKDPNHSLTCSFWVKCSLAGTYNAQYRADDVGNYFFNRAFTVVANTWTKVTHTIPGNASLAFNNDTGIGLGLVIVPYYGTDYTAGTVSNDTWFTLSSNNYFPDYAQNFMNTSSATFDLTGVQLEVGSKATPFEHRTYADDLAKCQRYYERYTWDSTGNQYVGVGVNYQTGTDARFAFPFLTRKRTNNPTTVFSGTYKAYPPNETITLTPAQGNDKAVRINIARTTSFDGGSGCLILATAGTYAEVEDEL